MDWIYLLFLKDVDNTQGLSSWGLTMKYLFICLLVLGAGLVGCNTNKTGYECGSCKKEIAKYATTCPHCGRHYSYDYPPHKVGE